MARHSQFQVRGVEETKPLDDRTFRQLLRRVSLTLSLGLGIPLVLLVGLVMYQFHSADKVAHTDAVISQAQRVDKSLMAMQTSFRGFRLANQPSYLAGYSTAESRVHGELDVLEKLVADNAGQLGEVRQTRQELGEWINFVESELSKVADGQTPVHDASFMITGAPMFDRMIKRLEAFIAMERRLWEVRDARLDRIRNSLLGALAIGVLIVPLLLGWIRRVLHHLTASYQSSLTEAERRARELQVTLHSIGDAVVATDEKGRVEYLNPAAELLTGWNQADAKGKPLVEVFEIFNEDSKLKVENPVERVIRENVVVGLANHTVLRSRHGREVPIEDSAAPIRNDAGKVIGVILVFHDVTEKRAGERLLRSSEKRLRFLHDLGQATRSLSDPSEILEVTTRLLGEQLQVSRCAYADVEEDGERFTIQYDYTRDCATTVGDYQLSLFGERAAAKMRSGRLLVIRDLDAEFNNDPGLASFNAMGVKAIICAPLIRDGRLRAMMAVHQTAARQWTNTEIALVEEVVGRCWSVMEQARAEGGLNNSNSLRGTIINTALDAFVMMDHEGVIRDWNVAAERIFGYAKKEAVGRKLGELIVPERLRAAHEAGVQHYLRTREPKLLGQRIELPAVRADGKEIPTETSFTHIPGTEPPLFAGYLRDISVRKAALAGVEAAREKAEADARLLSESLERFRLLVDVVSIHVWTADLDGKVDFANQPGVEYLGLDSDEALMGEGWGKFVHEDDLPLVVKRWEQSLANQERYQMEFRLRSKSGEYRWFLSRAEPLRDANGSVVRWFGVNTEIHELKTAQSELERASRAKDEFMAMLSHELRTPLTPVLMTAAALREDDRLPEEVRDQLGMMERNIGLESRLIDDLLDLNGISRGKLNLQKRLSDAHSLIALAAEIVLDEAQAKEIQVIRDFKAENAGLYVDPTRFQQVIWNLLRNAVKFTPRGGRIEIKTLNVGTGMRIEIADTGIGIEAALLERIFVPFDQGMLSGDHRFGGMGLGLAIARAVVKAHGGTLVAQSDGHGKGSAFVVEMPEATALASGVRMEEERLEKQPSPALGGRYRILLIEDHEPTLLVLSRFLKRAGHEVVTANCVKDALDHLEGTEFDLVISDLGLPDGTGIGLMRQLRQTRETPGIALSGYGMEEDLIRSREVGFHAHLVKPVVMNQLLRTIDQVMSETRK